MAAATDGTVVPEKPADLHFYFDPVCQFAWMTSTWVRQVQAAKDYRVQWHFISLRLINEHIDYASHFPAAYETVHTAGLRMLRVAAAVRAEHGHDAVADYYASCGAHIFEREPWSSPEERLESIGTVDHVASILALADLPTHHTSALDDAGFDEVVRTETQRALSLTGKDVGTPILQVDPPYGMAFFGPVISRRPSPAESVELWDHVLGLARFGGFAELKRSLRERPQLPVFGVVDGIVEDWHQGSTRPKH